MAAAELLSAASFADPAAGGPLIPDGGIRRRLRANAGDELRSFTIFFNGRGAGVTRDRNMPRQPVASRLMLGSPFVD
jgi:hypothetical protein